MGHHAVVGEDAVATLNEVQRRPVGERSGRENGERKDGEDCSEAAHGYPSWLVDALNTSAAPREVPRMDL